jgi:hypothetical protein
MFSMMSIDKKISQEKGEVDNKILFALVGVATVAIFILGLVVTSNAAPKELEKNAEVKLEFQGPSTHDWGAIDIFGGNVEKIFTVKNTGEGTLQMTNFKTSCMCTEVQVELAGEKSPMFGMHSASNWVANLGPGEEANLRVIYDPLAHGPNATGPVTRFVSFDTNDPSLPYAELRANANVVKK